MEGRVQVAAYATADFSEPNQRFCALFAQRFPDFAGRHIIDLGCGPADIPIRLARVYNAVRVSAVDGSAAMLEYANRAAIAQDMGARIECVQWRIGTAPMPVRLAAAGDAVISNSLLHHLADPQALWTAIGGCAAPGAAVLVMDLCRPANQNAARSLVDQYAADEPPILKRDFLNSLMASYREGEVRAQLASAGLREFAVERVSDRHWAVCGRVV
jgi:SAM-dependent methyltransferase